MTTTNFAIWLLFAVFLAAVTKAPLLAPACVTPCLVIVARSLEIVDTSSASHPLRIVTPLVCAAFAVGALAWYSWKNNLRAMLASILVLASCAPELVALHPLFWAHTQTWALLPLEIGICTTILAVLVVPDSWVKVRKSNG